jgi:large subunit ribosomal protein L1
MAEAKKKVAKKTTKVTEADLVVETTKEVQDGTSQENDQTAVQADEQATEEVEATKTEVAKAGKRSTKALKEAEEKQAKEERKAHKVEAEADDKPKQKQNPPRSKLQRKSKGYRKLAEQVEKGKEYSLAEAIALAIKTSPVKFDATVELHANLGVDPRHADQNIRDIVVLPAGTGKTVRIAVFADVDGAAAAKKAGADIAGEEDIIKLLDKGTLDFDVLIATPQMMAKLGKYAKTLGPKGLMPNPKSGTVTADVAKGVNEAKAGRVEYRVDGTGIVHLGVGKVSFGADKLADNLKAVLASIKSAKPASLKGTYVKALYLTTTMGPSIRLTPTEL